MTQLATRAKVLDDVILQCANLDAGYGDELIVKNFSLNCKAAQVVGIVGPNGSGKSTLVKRIAGVLPNRGGSVTLGGVDASNLGSGRLARMGLRYVPQIRDVFPSLNVRENLIIGMDGSERLEQVLETLPELRNLLRRKAGRLSGGERKLLAIGRALMVRKLEILLVDEPSAGLSPKAAEKMWPILANIASAGAGVLIVEQNVDALLDIADHVYVLVNGHNRLDASPEEIRRTDLGALFLE